MSVLHTCTQDGKCSFKAPFDIGISYVTEYVNIGHNDVAPSQLVSALNSNGGVVTTKPLLYTVYYEERRNLEGKNVCESHRFKKGSGQLDEIRLKDSKEIITSLEYYGFDSLVVSYTAGAWTKNVLDTTDLALPPDDDCNNDIDHENGEVVVYDMELVEHLLEYDYEATDSTGDANCSEPEVAVGFIESVYIVSGRSHLEKNDEMDATLKDTRTCSERCDSGFSIRVLMCFVPEMVVNRISHRRASISSYA